MEGDRQVPPETGMTGHGSQHQSPWDRLSSFHGAQGVSPAEDLAPDALAFHCTLLAHPIALTMWLPTAELNPRYNCDSSCSLISEAAVLPLLCGFMHIHM